MVTSMQRYQLQGDLRQLQLHKGEKTTVQGSVIYINWSIITLYNGLVVVLQGVESLNEGDQGVTGLVGGQLLEGLK